MYVVISELAEYSFSEVAAVAGMTVAEYIPRQVM